MRRIILIVAVLVIGLAIGGYVFFNGERKAPVRYRTAAVERGSVVSVVTATGTINPVVSVQVGTQVYSAGSRGKRRAPTRSSITPE